MTDQSNDDQKVLADLTKAKALFQQRSILAAIGVLPPGSKDDQEKVATPDRP